LTIEYSGDREMQSTAESTRYREVAHR